MIPILWSIWTIHRSAIQR